MWNTKPNSQWVRAWDGLLQLLCQVGRGVVKQYSCRMHLGTTGNLQLSVVAIFCLVGRWLLQNTASWRPTTGRWCRPLACKFASRRCASAFSNSSPICSAMDMASRAASTISDSDHHVVFGLVLGNSNGNMLRSRRIKIVQTICRTIRQQH